ncbi:MAG: response regulator transcription factor [Anaerolineae bacterium]
MNCKVVGPASLHAGEVDMRVALISAAAIGREGLRRLLCSTGQQVVGVYASVPEALAGPPDPLPEVVYMSAPAAAQSGVQGIEALRGRLGDAAVVLLGAGYYDRELAAVVRCSACCYLSSDYTPAALALAGRAARLGYALMDRRALPQLTQAPEGNGNGHEGLTSQEWRVASLLAQGLSNREIAARLGVRPHTVKRHVSNILVKLGVADRLQAALWAAERGGMVTQGTGARIARMDTEGHGGRADRMNRMGRMGMGDGATDDTDGHGGARGTGPRMTRMDTEGHGGRADRMDRMEMGDGDADERGWARTGMGRGGVERVKGMGRMGR